MSNSAKHFFKIFYFKILAVICILGIYPSLYPQDLALSTSKLYTIKQIEVTGNTSFNEKTVIAYSGLKEGQQVYLPGDAISKTIKKLWDLGLFKNVNIYLTKTEGTNAYIEISLEQLPVLKEARIDGVSRSKAEDFITENNLNPNTKVTENLVITTKNYIRNHYKKKGFLNAKVIANTIPVKDSVNDQQQVQLLFKVFKGDRVKIGEVRVVGNEEFPDSKIQKHLKKTKAKKFWRFWKPSKYIASDFETDKANVIEKYKEKGFRDARIITDTIYNLSENLIDLELSLEEGNKYYFGDISFLGNSVFSDEQLADKIVLQKGDVYNAVLLEKRISDATRPDAEDITNLYQNNGYFFSRIVPVETGVENDTINFEVRITEGKLARFNEITVSGNTKTNDHVLYRNIRTVPGAVYSKDKIVRSIRELGQTNFFDTEQLVPNIKNIDQNAGLLDIDYSVVEKGSSQFELQGGYGGTGFIGTLGLRFNNFSIRNIFNKESYKPLPSGDGQSLSIRAQYSRSFRVHSFSFIEPWLGGKKPFQLSLSFSRTKQFDFDFTTNEVDKNQSFLVTSGNVGIQKRLRWPDDYFTLSQNIGFRHFDLQNFNTGLFTFGDGTANDFSYTLGITRDNTSVSPIFPTGGSRISLTAKASIPYSAFSNATDWEALAIERRDINTSENRISEIDQERFKWLEYYKLKLSGDWYSSLSKKFVFKSSFQFGFLGAYNQDRGVIPFERFQLGGSGLGANSGIVSVENVPLRGYPDAQVVSTTTDLSGNIETSTSGSTIFNKFSLELRYPISFNPAATIYALGFVEAGAAFDSFRQFDPFRLNRSAGLGIRVFMPAFGLLGVDFGYGFDKLLNESSPHGWETHFVLGQQF